MGRSPKVGHAKLVKTRESPTPPLGTKTKMKSKEGVGPVRLFRETFGYRPHWDVPHSQLSQWPARRGVRLFR